MNRCGDFCWSIRRELWENRAIWIAPLVLAAVLVAGFLFAANHWTPAFRARHPVAAFMPYGLAASAILFSGWMVGVFYSLDALNGERRDRSILFWKSMPVSDVTTVLVKVAVPLVVIPIVTIAVALATQAIMLVAGMAILSSRDIDPLLPWTLVPWLPTTVALLYGMAAHALWFAPIFGYLLLVSAWVRRAAFLWAVMPFFAAGAVEAIAFGSTHVAQLVKYRLDRRHAGVQAGCNERPDHPALAARPGPFLHIPRPVAGTRIRRNLHCRSNPAPSLSRAALEGAPSCAEHSSTGLRWRSPAW